MVVTLEDSKLMARRTNQNKCPIFAESETLSFSKIADAQLEFFKNDTGEVTHLALHQGGRETKRMKK